jgi:KGK domain
MPVSNQFKPLADGEVVIVNDKNTYRVSDLAIEIRSKIADHLAEFTEWSNDQGIEGEALRFGSRGWEKGKVRLHLSIEFCPNDDVAQGNAHVASNTINPATPAYTSAASFSASSGSGESSHQLSAVASPAAMPDTTVMAAAATGVVATTATAAVLQDSPPSNSNSIDMEVDPGTETATFDMGTMSEATGEINMHLNDRDSSDYVDFDRSDSLPEDSLDLDDIMAQAQSPRPSIIDEVWTEMSQPNWPGVFHA